MDKLFSGKELKAQYCLLNYHLSVQRLVQLTRSQAPRSIPSLHQGRFSIWRARSSCHWLQERAIRANFPFKTSKLRPLRSWDSCSILRYKKAAHSPSVVHTQFHVSRLRSQGSMFKNKPLPLASVRAACLLQTLSNTLPL